ELQIPWVNDESLPDGLEPKVDWRHWLGPMQDRRGVGFAVNNIGQDSVFSFFEERRTAFMPESQKIRLPDKSGNMTSYRRYQFSRAFIANKVGQYSFGPVTLKGIFATGLDPDRGAISKDIYAVAKPLLVNIKDVPEEGRPDTYIGAIGSFQFSAELAPHKAKTGDPMTLTLTLSGQGTLDSTLAPDLSKIPEIAKNFKIYEATEQTKGNQRLFTYSLRPLESGIEQFPPVTISYFDIEQEKYVTLASSPISVQIEKADALASRDIVGASNILPTQRRELEMRQEGIFANITDPGQLTDESIRPVRWLAGLGTLLITYAAVAFAAVRVRRLNSDMARQRRRLAPGKAHRLLGKAMQELRAGRLREGADRLESAIVELVADWTNSSAAGMTAAEACQQLQTLGIDGKVLSSVSELLEKCESVHYGATLHASEQLGSEAKPVLDAVISALKKTRSRG
ncbi:MAG TPA: BatD family protein, partial [Thermoguttaceae bacterium]